MEVETGAAAAEERLKEYEERFKDRYTMSEPYYYDVTVRAKNPIPPPRMSNWPPFSRGRRPRDRSWRQTPRRDYHQRARHHDNSRNMDYDKLMEGYSRSKRQRAQQSYHDIEEKSTEDASTTVSMATTDDSDGVVTSPPIATGGKEKPHKGQQQPQHVLSHFVPFSEAAIEMGLAENRVAPSDTDVKAILTYASVAIETRKDTPRGTDKQQTLGGKQAKREEGEFSTATSSSRRHESNKKSHKKHRSRAREEEPSVVTSNLHLQNLLPADLIEQDDDEGENPPAAPVVQVSNTKLIIRPPKVPSSPQAGPVADTTAPSKKAAKKKKKKDKTQHSLKLKVKVQEDYAHIVP